MPIAAAATIGDLRLVRGCAIGARGKVRSVVLVGGPSDRGARERRARSLVADERGPRAPHRAPPSERQASRGWIGLQAASAIQAIGDRTRRRRHRRPGARRSKGSSRTSCDLGEAWMEWTGLPFVFAAWCGRPGALDARRRASPLATRSSRGLAAARRHRRRARARSRARCRRRLRAYLRRRDPLRPRRRRARGPRALLRRSGARGPAPAATRVRFFDEDRRGQAPLPASRLPVRHAPRARGRRGRACCTRRRRGPPARAEAFAASTSASPPTPCGRGSTPTGSSRTSSTATSTTRTSARRAAASAPSIAPLGHAEGYVLSREVLGKKLQEVVDAGGVQILLQGGLQPGPAHRVVRGPLPLDEARRTGSASTRCRPRRSSSSARLEGSVRARACSSACTPRGSTRVPGGGAEILVDRVRRKIAKAKCTSEEWLGVMRVGAPDGASVERHDDVRHGRHAARPREPPRQAPRPAGRDGRLHGVLLLGLPARAGDAHRRRATRARTSTCGSRRSRASCSTTSTTSARRGSRRGRRSARSRSRFGADDFGSVMFEENVVSSAGTTFCMNADGMESRIRAAGFKAARRNVRYDWLDEPSGAEMPWHARRSCRRRRHRRRRRPPRRRRSSSTRRGRRRRRPRRRRPPAARGGDVERVRGVVFPGLVNAHTHVELSALRGARARAARVRAWVERFVGRAAEVAAEDEARGGRARRARSSTRVATAAVGEVTNRLVAVHALARAGIGGCVFHEVFGAEKEPLAARRRRAGEGASRRRVGAWPTLRPRLRRRARTRSTRRTRTSCATPGASARERRRRHEPPPGRARGGASRARVGDGPMAELARVVEPRLPRDGFPWPQRRPVAHAGAPRRARPSRPLRAPDRRARRRARPSPRRATRVVLCPRSNLLHRGPASAARSPCAPPGSTPALGTDSLASNASLDVLAEARALFDRFPGVPARELLQMATWNGARALGRPDLGRSRGGRGPASRRSWGARRSSIRARFCCARSRRRGAGSSRRAAPERQERSPVMTVARCASRRTARSSRSRTRSSRFRSRRARSSSRTQSRTRRSTALRVGAMLVCMVTRAHERDGVQPLGSTATSTPRTRAPSARHVPAGTVSPARGARAHGRLTAVLFLASAALARASGPALLSPVVLAVLLGYSLREARSRGRARSGSASRSRSRRAGRGSAMGAASRRGHRALMVRGGDLALRVRRPVLAAGRGVRPRTTAFTRSPRASA